MGNTDFAVADEIDFAAAGTVGTVETAGIKPSGSLAYFDSDYKDFGKTAAVGYVENVVEVRIVGKLLDQSSLWTAGKDQETVVVQLSAFQVVECSSYSPVPLND
jgi:hypothetical protein